MRYAIISDIHGNLEALEAVIQACQSQGVEDYYCIGDIVGYGADLNACIKAVQALKAKGVAGNHDCAVLGEYDFNHFNPLAKEAIQWSQRHLQTNCREYLQKLPLIFKNDFFLLVHGSLDEPEKFHYSLDISSVKDTFNLMDRNVCFIGHTHVPEIFIQEGQRIYTQHRQVIHVDPDKRYIINTGSVGQPRDGDPRCAFCLYDTDQQTIKIQRVVYDLAKTQKKITEAGLPVFLAQRLARGQ